MADALETVLAACRALPAPWTLLIDGRSGAGKSTLADGVVAATGAQLVRLDDVYPGWDGLDAGARLVRQGVLVPRAAGRDGAWRRWDWAAGAAAEQHPVAAARSLVVEGCGALGGDARAAADLGVWVELPAPERKRRALARDGDVFRANWRRWAAQERAYLRREHPAARADLTIAGPGRRTSGPR